MAHDHQQRRDQSGNRFLFRGLISLDSKHASVLSARVIQEEETSKNKSQHGRTSEKERKEKSNTAERRRVFVHVQRTVLMKSLKWRAFRFFRAESEDERMLITFLRAHSK